MYIYCNSQYAPCHLAKFIVLNTRFRVCYTKSLVLNTKFIIFTHSAGIFAFSCQYSVAFPKYLHQEYTCHKIDPKTGVLKDLNGIYNRYSASIVPAPSAVIRFSALP